MRYNVTSGGGARAYTPSVLNPLNETGLKFRAGFGCKLWYEN